MRFRQGFFATEDIHPRYRGKDGIDLLLEDLNKKISSTLSARNGVIYKTPGYNAGGLVIKCDSIPKTLRE